MAISEIAYGTGRRQRGHRGAYSRGYFDDRGWRPVSRGERRACSVTIQKPTKIGGGGLE